MILVVSDAFFSLSDVHITPHTITTTVTMLAEGTPWSISCVYRPQDDHEKRDFIDDLRNLKAVARSSWLLLGDLNLITKASDKNNLNINRCLIDKFHAVHDFLELKDMRMDGRRFTWSNVQSGPMLTKIDHVFFSNDWDMLFPDAHLQAITPACSDHAPLFLQGMVNTTRKPCFKFEEFWLCLEGFKEAVLEVWNKQLQAIDPIRRFHIKLSRTAMTLNKWQRTCIRDLRKKIAMAKDIIWHLD
jgi:hypothetical protein